MNLLRSWNGHLEYFVSGKIYSTYFKLFSFTKYSVLQKPIQMIVLQNTLMNTQHVLTLCYNVSKVNIIEVINILSVLEVLSIVLEMGKEIFFIGNIVLYALSFWFLSWMTLFYWLMICQHYIRYWLLGV